MMTSLPWDTPLYVPAESDNASSMDRILPQFAQYNRHMVPHSELIKELIRSSHVLTGYVGGEIM